VSYALAYVWPMCTLLDDHYNNASDSNMFDFVCLANLHIIITKSFFHGLSIVSLTITINLFLLALLGRIIWKNKVLHTTLGGISGRTFLLLASSLLDFCSSHIFNFVLWRNLNKLAAVTASQFYWKSTITTTQEKRSMIL